MTRPKNHYCESCDTLTRRMYIRPTGGNPKPIGFVCLACGRVKFDEVEE